MTEDEMIGWHHRLNGHKFDPLGLALGSPIFPSGCEGKLGVAPESLQGRRLLKRLTVVGGGVGADKCA